MFRVPLPVIEMETLIPKESCLGWLKAALLRYSVGQIKNRVKDIQSKVYLRVESILSYFEYRAQGNARKTI